MKTTRTDELFINNASINNSGTVNIPSGQTYNIDGVPIGGGGSGDVVGPSSSTNNAVARFDSTTGKLLQNSLATIDDNGASNVPFAQTYNINGFPIRQYVSNQTSDSTPTELFIDGTGAAQRLLVADTSHTTWLYTYKCVGIDDGLGGSISFEGKGMLQAFGGVITLFGNTDTLLNAQGPMVGSTVVASADNGNGALIITVTDNSGSTQSNWNCLVDIAQVIGI